MGARHLLAAGFVIASCQEVSAAPFGFSKNLDLAAASCVAGGQPSFLSGGADAYTCPVPKQEFFPQLTVTHVPTHGVCHVEGVITVDDAPDGLATKKAFDRLAQHIQNIEGEPLRTVDLAREGGPIPLSKDWLSSIADGNRRVEMRWLFLPDERDDKLQSIRISVGAFGNTTGKIHFAMSFDDWPKCFVPSPLPTSPIRFFRAPALN